MYHDVSACGGVERKEGERKEEEGMGQTRRAKKKRKNRKWTPHPPGPYLSAPETDTKATGNEKSDAKKSACSGSSAFVGTGCGLHPR